MHSVDRAVTRFRTLLLLLVALLLPIRGVVAATMPCAGMGQGQRVVMAHAHPVLAEGAGEPQHAHVHAGAHGHVESPDPSQGMADDDTAKPASSDAPDGAVSDTCHLCASGCGVAVLLMSLPAGLAEPPAAPVCFPALALPPLDFQLDGQDRPPRSF